MTEADSKNYWISPTALKITLNALSDADYMQASAASGAMIMCYMKGIDGLEYDYGHNYKRWPLKIAPTYFTSVSRKYVYVRIPRPTADPAETESDVAQVVFPSERIDLYGMTEEGELVGEDKYYYIYTQGIISASEPTDEGLRRHWEQDMVTGTLASDEATEGGGTGEWWMYDPITDMVTFTKTIASAIFEYLEAAQAVIHNLNVTGVFDAIKGYIDDLRSHNFQSGLLDGAGFRLTSDNGEGASELEVDMLKVRKKATFMELEIREETFVGGNQHYSPAGSTIYRVDYLDENDQMLGYTVMKVPFLLKRFAFLGKMFNYAARKRIRRSMSDDEWKQCHHFRCYLLADDGTTATRNWWQVGDQPRCQTFNKAISAQNKRDNGYNWKRDHFNDDPSTPMPKYTTIEGPVETSYYWRLVTNVGSEKLEDGHAYDFIDMPYEGWDIVKGGVRYHYTDDEKRSFRDGGSGIPVAGDTIVCMGNRTKQDRMNMISLYTSGSENNPPAIKGYRGIHTFKINQENRVFELSPEEVLIRSKAFRLLDDSGYEFPVPLERGEWQQGVRYHWYDRVSWKGSIWLCQVLDDYQWVDIAGNSYETWRVEDIDYGEGDYEYAAGMADHYYRTGRVNGIQVYYIKYYTTSEPDRNNDLWLREVSKGTEIVSSEIHYSASLDGLNHPADDAADWKTTIAATGISMGKYLWTRTTIHYDDPNDPDREPTREYSVARWGIDGDGIAEIDSYYLATSNAALVVNTQTDTYPKPGDAGWAQAGTQAKWYATFGEAAAANGGVGAMQGWNVWEKTIIKYDAYNTDGTKKTVPDLVNYRCSRIGQDGQIGEEEYYMLAESDDFATVFGSATPDYAHIGIRWYNQSNPAAERWRLSATTPNINTQMWSAVRPTYNKDVHGKKVYLWNFEQRVDGTGTEYATRPVCIGNHARGIKGVIELYALSASQTPVSADRPIPADINAKNQWGVIPTSGFEDPQVWGDEKYDRAPTEALPYQWNWTRTLYSSKDADGKDYEDHYHVSAVRGTRGEDGAGIEFIYCRPQSHNADGTPIAVTMPDPNVKKDAGGTARTAEYIKTHDDFVPYQWTDNPVGIDFLHQIEYRSERKSSAVAGTGGFTGGHEWGLFSAAAVHSKWGKNGQDGDGVEYVYIRTATNVAPTITNSSDTYGGKTYLDDDYLPLSSAGRCTDDPVGTSHSLPYEWVVKRTKGAPDAETGVRQWEKYSGTMALWATFSENVIRLDISNEMDMTPTTAALRIDTARTVETTVRLFDGATEVDISSAAINVSGGPASTIATASQAADGKGRKLSWAFKAGQTMAAAYEISLSYTYKSVAYTAVFTVSASKGEAVWQLKPSLSAIPFQRNSDNTLTPASRAVGLSLVKIDGGSTATYTSVQTGLTVRYSTSSMPSSASAGSGWSSGNITVANTADNLYIALFNASGTLLDRETVPVVKDGENGKSITKKSESYRYATNNTGTRPAASSSDWKTTKPTLQKGYWLFTETTITWSDNSTTVLYTDERNPNDGVAGQDIIVDGSTEMKYYVGDSNTSHPAESSSDWKDLSQITQTQGKWLWSKATTYYRKASSAAGSKDAGHSVNYNVSYISKDGAAGRAVTGITEYYKATNSNAEMPVPTSDSGWSTNPNVSNWGANAKYLWNYEKVTYSSGTTVERTKPQIVAIWTKDGKGIDSITNYYKITSSATAPSKPSTDGSDGWDDDPTAPGAGEYLWNYEKVTYTDGSVFRLEVQLIGHVGTNGAEGKGIKLTLNRNGAYTDAQWNTWCAIGHTESWSYRSGDQSFTDCRVGDIFVIAGSSSDTGRNHVAQFRCTTVSSSSITGVCISHIADGESIQGAAGHVGRWYYYADEWNANTEYKFEATKAPYVKRGSNYYMLDCAAWPDTQQSSSTYTSKGQDPASYGSGNPWSPMTAVFKYIITEALFTNNAKLGSFVINGDWMITKHGLIFDSSGGVHLIDDTHSYSGYSTSNAYTLFNPNYPNASRSGVMNFCPAWAVDGMVGRQYHNGVYDTNKAGSVSIDSAGFAVKWGGEGFRVGTAGLQRYDNVRDAWLPMYNKRNIVVDKYKRYGRYTLPTDVDFFLNTYVEDNYDKQVQLPASSSLPDGAIITVRGWSEPCYTDVYAAPGDALSMGNTSIGYVEVENADRVDFVLCKQLSPATWLVNYYDVDY